MTGVLRRALMDSAYSDSISTRALQRHQHRAIAQRRGIARLGSGCTSNAHLTGCMGLI